MRGRNVMLVILESTGARHLGLYGGTPDPAPNLTALARRSILFERAYAVYPESIKGLFATLCSRYPAFDTPPELYAEVPCVSLPATLASAGYRTALFHSGRFVLSRHAVGDRPSRVRGSRGCGSHRRTRGLELRGGRGVGRRADARLDRLTAARGNASSSPTCPSPVTTRTRRARMARSRETTTSRAT